MLNRIPTVEKCDASKADSSNAARSIITHIFTRSKVSLPFCLVAFFASQQQYYYWALVVSLPCAARR